MIKLKIVSPIGDVVFQETEISDWTDIESFKASHRFILESSDGSVFDYTTKEWVELPPDYQINNTYNKQSVQK
jgi:hypothetical protein